MDKQLLIERALVAASRAQSDGFENTSAALKEIAKLWNREAPLRPNGASDAANIAT